MISAAAIDLLVGAGASCAQLAAVARKNFPEIVETIDALISEDAPVAVVAALIKGHAADRGAAAREAERREANTKAQRKCRAKARRKRADVVQLNEPELPLPESPLSSMSYDTYDSDDADDSGDPFPSSSPPPPP
jgi:hypothetical protein